jgi:hypothetical protein
MRAACLMPRVATLATALLILVHTARIPQRVHALVVPSLSPSLSRCITVLQATHQQTTGSQATLSRRAWGGILAGAAMLTASTPGPGWALDSDIQERAKEREFLQEYGDFIKTGAGWSYRNVNEGGGAGARVGDRVVYDWSGYTIGYFGRPFQAKGGPQGGAFDRDLDYYRTVIGSGTIVSGEYFAPPVSCKLCSVSQITPGLGPLTTRS